ncbi:MAG: restriction endonuclease subunit S, partial [Candidatus Kapaibacterium sp.]
MKKYPKYKNANIEWLDQIPEHWEISRLANNGRFYKGRGISKSVLTLEGNQAVIYGDIYTKYN